MKTPLRAAAIAFGTLLTLAGCSQSGDQDQAPQAQGPDPSAQSLETYRQLVRIHNDDMATTTGNYILTHYPNTDAAKEVQQTLPDIEKRFKETTEKNRLTALWIYQVSPMAGGTQSTATIYSSQPSGNDRVRLVLRRHTEWGQNAFLFGEGHGFVCRAGCSLKATFDGKPSAIKAVAPSTGEPALVFDNDKAFIAQLQKAKRITIDVTTADDGKKETLVYEVGGFDADKWQPLPKSAGKKK